MKASGESKDFGASPTRQEGEATSAFLARVLTDLSAPEWMVTLAQEGHYDDFKSPLAMPETQLYHDANASGLPQIAEWVKEGVFDSTREESTAWAQSPDGQATFAELLGGIKNRAQRRAEERKRRRGRGSL
jgi:hypothetical protein